MRQFFVAQNLGDIYDKVIAGERLSFDDGVRLYHTDHLDLLGYLANRVRHNLHGKRVFYVRNQHLNPTNICEYNCMFCSFRRDEGEDGAYFYDMDKVRDKVAAMDPKTTEIHIVSGLHPDLPFQYYLDLLKTVQEVRPDIFIKAFTAVEIVYFAEKFAMSYADVFKALQDVGLKAMPGGGAEVFSDRVHQKLCKEKATPQQWLEVHGVAHSLGIKTNATMLYGHIETAEERVNHFILLREQQDRSGGFVSFIPLAYQHENNRIGKLPQHTANLDMKTFAISRLMLDNVPHVKAYWVTIGPKLAQLALHYGADELEGTVVEETIMHLAGAEERGMTEDALVRLIATAGYQPVERDALYNVVDRSDKMVEVAR